MSFDLASLPDPAVVEPIDYETICSALVAAFQARWPDYSALLESDPAIKLLEVAAYREMLLRHRINEAARSQLLAFATGGDLDHLAAFYGVARLADESDEALRQRVRARIQGFSNAGGAAHYRYWALSASTAIQDVAVVSPAPGVVRICVLVKDGANTDAVLDAVRVMVLRDDVRVLTDTIEVVDAQMRPFSVAARIVRQPGAPASLLTSIADALRAELMQNVRLGWDVTRSWLISRLHRVGVHRVELLSPNEEIACAPNEAVRLERIDLLDGGIDD